MKTVMNSADKKYVRIHLSNVHDWHLRVTLDQNLIEAVSSKSVSGKITTKREQKKRKLSFVDCWTITKEENEQRKSKRDTNWRTLKHPQK